jgi:hypothetical protein
MFPVVARSKLPRALALILGGFASNSRYEYKTLLDTTTTAFSSQPTNIKAARAPFPHPKRSTSSQGSPPSGRVPSLVAITCSPDWDEGIENVVARAFAHGFLSPAHPPFAAHRDRRQHSIMTAASMTERIVYGFVLHVGLDCLLDLIGAHLQLRSPLFDAADQRFNHLLGVVAFTER